MEWLANNWSWTLIATGVVSLQIMTMVLTAPLYRTAKAKIPLKKGDRL